MLMKLLGIITVNFDMRDQLLIRFSAPIRHCRKNGSKMGQYISYLQNGTVHQLFTDSKKAYLGKLKCV